jgi:hypothetical protein
MRRTQPYACVAAIAAGLALLAGCGGTASTPAATTTTASAKLARWTAYIHVTRPLDLAGPPRAGA